MLHEDLSAAADHIQLQLEGDRHAEPEAARDHMKMLRAAAEIVKTHDAHAAELERLRDRVAALDNHYSALGQYLLAAHLHGDVDEEARVKLDGSDGENTLSAALRLLRLAHSRGAFTQKAQAAPATTFFDAEHAADQQASGGGFGGE